MSDKKLEDLIGTSDFEVLRSLKPAKSFRSYQITNAAQACLLSIGASWGVGKLTSIRLGTGSRYLAIPIWLPSEGVGLIARLHFDERWNFKSLSVTDFKWICGTSLPNFGLKDKEWAWVEYAKVALSERNQINPIFKGKATTSYYFLKL
jgi:hypothetical protein